MNFHWKGSIGGVITSVVGILVANQTILTQLNPKVGAVIGIIGAIVAARSQPLGQAK